MAKNHIITGLDIGTKFIKALSAVKKNGSENLEVLGQAELPSFGVRRGIVVKIDEVSKIIGEVLSQLQADIGQKIEEVYINISGSHIFSLPSRGSVVVSRADQRISEEDTRRVIQTARAISIPSNQEILDIFPKEFIIDGQAGIKEPTDIQGLKLEAEVILLCGFAPYLKNLTTAVLNAGFQISDITFSSIASSRACLTPQQKELGVGLIDIGAGTTDLAVYEEGDLIHAAVFPIGSERITNDLAIGLKTDIELAEKIKKEFGSCLLLKGNKKERIEPSGSGNGEPLVFSHKMLVRVIEARVAEIFNLVWQDLKKISPRSLLPAGIVITGGGARLPKMVELAKKELKLPVKIGLPKGIVGIEKDPAWSTACGLVLEGQEPGAREEKLILALGRGAISKIKKIFKVFIP